VARTFTNVVENLTMYIPIAARGNWPNPQRGWPAGKYRLPRDVHGRDQRAGQGDGGVWVCYKPRISPIKTHRAYYLTCKLGRGALRKTVGFTYLIELDVSAALRDYK